MPNWQVSLDSGVRGGISTGGIFWSKAVPPSASTDVYVLEAQAERDEVLRQLMALNGLA